MRSRSVSAVLLASLTLSWFALSSASALAGEPAKQKELAPDSMGKQFQWEEKVVGPQTDKKIDHAKIAALQEQGRKDEANRRNQPAPKMTRAAGIAAPASSTLPTMDIEKAAPAGSVRMPTKKVAKAEAPKSHDAIDDVLAMATTESKVRPAKVASTRTDKTRRGKHARRSGGIPNVWAQSRR